jgi:hypothetical protein
MQVSFCSLAEYSHHLPRNRAKVVKGDGLWKCFLVGGNSTLRQHCWQHYELYKERCEEANIPVNHRAIPPKIVQMGRKDSTQTMLDDRVVNVNRPENFKHEGLLRAMAQFIACNDQVSRSCSIKEAALTDTSHPRTLKAFAVANNKLFQNCLVSMRPKTKASELPSSHDIGVYLHNECVRWLEQLRKDILVSNRRAQMTSKAQAEEYSLVFRQHLARSQRQWMDGWQITPRQRFWG